MQFFVTDETNLEKAKDADFFIYGGLTFPADTLNAVTTGIEQIRVDAGYGPLDKLKFDTRVRPEQVSIEQAREAKSRVVDLCLALDVKLIVYVVHHEIAAERSVTERVTFGVNTVLRSFHSLLEEKDEIGIVVCDNLPVEDQTGYFVEKFTQGLKYPNKIERLHRIQLYATTSINMSHIASAVDVVLGSFRYSINNPKNKEAASSMMLNVARMMWADGDGDRIQPFEKGFILRPMAKSLAEKYHGKYKEMYDQLIEHINDLIKE
jgi:hypothetical protein